jgi:hypothetical protein
MEAVPVVRAQPEKSISARISRWSLGRDAGERAIFFFIFGFVPYLLWESSLC